MKTRIVLGAAMIAIMAGLLTLDWWLQRNLYRQAGGMAPPAHWSVGLPLAVLLAVLLVPAFAEFSRMTAANGIVPLATSGLMATIALGLLPYWLPVVSPFGAGMGAAVAAVGLSLGGIFLEQMLRFRVADGLRRVGCTMLAAAYLGIGAAVCLAMRIEFGVPAFVLFLAATKFADIGAYFTGSAIGRHKLIPWLSPGKTWEGLAGAVAFSAATAVAADAALMGGAIAIWKIAILGAVLGLAGQFGDLCESLLKRSSGLKDSGAVVPEFGGVLDILDSPLLAAPVGYLGLVLCLA